MSTSMILAATLIISIVVTVVWILVANILAEWFLPNSVDRLSGEYHEFVIAMVFAPIVGAMIAAAFLSVWVRKALHKNVSMILAALHLHAPAAPSDKWVDYL